MSTIKNSTEGVMEYKNMPDLRATAEKMRLNSWYEFGHEHYHQWFMMMRAKTKHDYRVEVKQQQKRVFVRRVPVLVAL